MPKSRKPKKKITRTKVRHKKSSHFVLLILVCALAIGAYFLYRSYINQTESTEIVKYPVKSQDLPTVCQLVEKNYGHEIDSCARLLHISPEYVKALACLECSGRTDKPNRFENHVYKRLLKVRDGKKASYEGVTTEMIRDASDEAIRNLATSWGPFQIMGYKCLHLDIKVADLRGENAVYWGIKWIAMEYGHLFQKERYKDAFHYHNAGCVFPKDGKSKTYDPKYVDNGLYYMEKFK